MLQDVLRLVKLSPDLQNGAPETGARNSLHTFENSTHFERQKPFLHLGPGPGMRRPRRAASRPAGSKSPATRKTRDPGQDSCGWETEGSLGGTGPVFWEAGLQSGVAGSCPREGPHVQWPRRLLLGPGSRVDVPNVGCSEGRAGAGSSRQAGVNNTLMALAGPGSHFPCGEQPGDLRGGCLCFGRRPQGQRSPSGFQLSPHRASAGSA